MILLMSVRFIVVMRVPLMMGHSYCSLLPFQMTAVVNNNNSNNKYKRVILRRQVCINIGTSTSNQNPKRSYSNDDYILIQSIINMNNKTTKEKGSTAIPPDQNNNKGAVKKADSILTSPDPERQRCIDVYLKLKEAITNLTHVMVFHVLYLIRKTKILV